MVAEASPLALLLHDAAEAFTGDIVKPLKIMLPEFAEIEQRIEDLIAAKYGVDFSHTEVKEIDQAMLIAERRRLFTKDRVLWTGEDKVRRLDLQLQMWDPEKAEAMFIRRAKELGVQ